MTLSFHKSPEKATPQNPISEEEISSRSVIFINDQDKRVKEIFTFSWTHYIIFAISKPMEWTITYYNDTIQNDILNMPKGFLARYLRYTAPTLECHTHAPWVMAFSN